MPEFLGWRSIAFFMPALWLACVWFQNENEKENDAASLSIDLGFPDEDDEQQHGGVLLAVAINI